LWVLKRRLFWMPGRHPVLSRELARLMAKGVEKHEVKGGWTGEGNCSNGVYFVGDFVGTFNGLATGRTLSHFFYV